MDFFVGKRTDSSFFLFPFSERWRFISKNFSLVKGSRFYSFLFNGISLLLVGGFYL